MISKEKLERAVELGRRVDAAQRAWDEANVAEQKAQAAYDDAKKAATAAADEFRGYDASLFACGDQLYTVRYLSDGYSSVVTEAKVKRAE